MVYVYAGGCMVEGAWRMCIVKGVCVWRMCMLGVHGGGCMVYVYGVWWVCMVEGHGVCVWWVCRCGPSIARYLDAWLAALARLAETPQHRRQFLGGDFG